MFFNKLISLDFCIYQIFMHAFESTILICFSLYTFINWHHVENCFLSLPFINKVMWHKCRNELKHFPHPNPKMWMGACKRTKWISQSHSLAATKGWFSTLTCGRKKKQQFLKQICWNFLFAIHSFADTCAVIG